MTEAEAKALLPELSSVEDNRRLDAALRLGLPGWNFAVPDLMRLAKGDPDHRVRKAAIDALGKIGDQRAYGLLDVIWKDTKEPHDIRNEALNACDRLNGLDETSDEQESGGSSGSPGDSQLGGI